MSAGVVAEEEEDRVVAEEVSGTCASGASEVPLFEGFGC